MPGPGNPSPVIAVFVSVNCCFATSIVTVAKSLFPGRPIEDEVISTEQSISVRDLQEAWLLLRVARVSRVASSWTETDATLDLSLPEPHIGWSGPDIQQ